MLSILQLFRPLTSFMASLAVFASAFIAAGFEINQYLIPLTLGMIVAFLFTSSGNAINDYFDRDIDRINHPERPIPSGKIKPFNAFLLSIIIFAMIVSLSWFINLLCFLIVILEIIFVFCYEKFLKKKGFVGNIMISVQTGFAFVFGGAIVNKIEITTILALLAFFAILGREIVKDIEDKEGDFDRMTLPKKIGVKNSSILSSVLIILAIVMSPLPLYPLGIFTLYYLPLIVIADLILISAIPNIVKNPRLSRKILKYGMILAMIAFIVGSMTTQG